jgi:hypothetical protein
VVAQCPSAVARLALLGGDPSIGTPAIAATIVGSGNAAAFGNAAPLYDLGLVRFYNDITVGSNGNCDQNKPKEIYCCNAVPVMGQTIYANYSGPIGLGTSNTLNNL